MAVKPVINRRTGEIKKGWWLVDYYPEGRNGPRRQQQFRCTQGEAIAMEMELRRASRQSPVSVNPKIVDLFPDWLEEYENDHLDNTVRDVKNCLVNLIPFFGGMFFTSLTSTIIEQYKAQRLKDGVKKRTINKELSYLSSFCKWAEEHINFQLPFKIKKFPEKHTKPAKPRIPSRDAVNKMAEILAGNKHTKKFLLPFLLMYDAGLRRTEALTLCAENIHKSANVIFVVGKGQKERVVPITTDRLRQAIEQALEEVKTGPLLINPKTKKPYTNIRKTLKTAAKKAGIEGRVYHHLMRHSFGTHALEAGVNLRALQGMMGHSTSKVTEGYTHLLSDYLAAEASKINQASKPTATSTEDVDIEDKDPKNKRKQKGTEN